MRPILLSDRQRAIIAAALRMASYEPDDISRRLRNHHRLQNTNLNELRELADAVMDMECLRQLAKNREK